MPPGTTSFLMPLVFFLSFTLSLCGFMFSSTFFTWNFTPYFSLHP